MSAPSLTPTNPSVIMRMAVLCWAVCIGVCVLALGWHDARPGDVRTERDAGVPRPYTVTLYAHPHCPCTRSSLEELAKIVTQAPTRAAYEVRFFRPGWEPDTWARSSNWDAAAEIPGVRAVSDPDGLAAKRAGAVTSGHVVVRDASGRTVYSGGITGSRAHVGENAGADAVLAWLRQNAGPSFQPVYGCAIQDEDSE